HPGQSLLYRGSRASADRRRQPAGREGRIHADAPGTDVGRAVHGAGGAGGAHGPARRIREGGVASPGGGSPRNFRSRAVRRFSFPPLKKGGQGGFATPRDRAHADKSLSIPSFDKAQDGLFRRGKKNCVPRCAASHRPSSSTSRRSTQWPSTPSSIRSRKRL